ncbi:MAG: hypothetical protein ABI891_14595, partial [Acidobacteriota bacterium]
MNKFKKSIFPLVGLSLVLFLFSLAAAQQQVKRSQFDVSNYVMDVQLVPNENKINATADVSFTTLEDARTVTFELNGSLKVESISRQNSVASANLPTKSKTPTTAAAPNQITFIQDQVGVSDIGPSVKIDLGETVTKGTAVTLRFKYSGVLISPSGGPLLTKRLAYIGPNNGYLMYAARWFPFH